MFRPLVCSLALTATLGLSAATIDSVARRLSAQAEGLDNSPFVSDSSKHADSTKAAGSFTRSLEAAVQLNENSATALATQDGQVRLAERSFAALGSAGGTTDSEFDADDFLNESVVESRGTSEFSITFTIARRGRLNLHSTLTARASGNINVVSVHASATVLNVKTGAVVWSSEAGYTPVTFDGAIALRSGTYRLVVVADTNLSDSGFTPNVGAAHANFAVSGDIAE